ncbi:MAG: D-tyrosyl-tRNA(Tyr) deacylase [Pirellulaceae bacterium]|nr:D-tyrosyl-tRNA(Tyr) deacylase [Pirellulaceae bacterium]
MRAVVQRVTSADVTVDDQIIGRIERGLVVLLGVQTGDSSPDVRYMCDKIIGLRIFGDADGKMNLSLQDIGGAALIISQFTLLADVRKGKRPSFIGAAPPDQARLLYTEFCDLVLSAGVPVATGQFAADMQVRLVNDGPVTIILDSRGSPA